MIEYFEATTPEQAYWQSEYEEQFKQFYEIDTELEPLQQIEHRLNAADRGEAEVSGLSAEHYKTLTRWHKGEL
jgi:hypothetical protein